MSKKFLFVTFSIDSGYCGVNHGIAFLIPIVKKYSYEVSAINLSSEASVKTFKNKVKSLNPSIVGFSCTSHQLKYLIKYSVALEEFPELLQIAGGPHPTIDPQETLSKASVKGVCIGEGEIPLECLLRNIENKRDISSTKGFFWKVNGAVKENPLAQFILDLSLIKFPDYSCFDKDLILQRWDNRKSLNVILSRGCPYDCHYCCNRVLKKVYPSAEGYFRIPPVEYCIDYLKHMLKLYPETEFIHFEDDLIISNRKWFNSFAQEYHRKINLPYRINARPESITVDIAKILRNSGCHYVYIGIESGNECLRNRMLNRKYSNDFVLEKCKIIKNFGIGIRTFNIVGFPFETRRQMHDTLTLNRKIAPQGGVCTFFFPYRNTELYKICKDENLLKNEDDMLEITNYNTRPAIELKGLSKIWCFYYQKKITFYFYVQEFKYILRRLNSSYLGIRKILLLYILIAYFLEGIARSYREFARIVTIKK